MVDVGPMLVDSGANTADSRQIWPMSDLAEFGQVVFDSKPCVGPIRSISLQIRSAMGQSGPNLVEPHKFDRMPKSAQIRTKLSDTDWALLDFGHIRGPTRAEAEQIWIELGRIWAEFDQSYADLVPK